MLSSGRGNCPFDIASARAPNGGTPRAPLKRPPLNQPFLNLPHPRKTLPHPPTSGAAALYPAAVSGSPSPSSTRSPPPGHAFATPRAFALLFPSHRRRLPCDGRPLWGGPVPGPCPGRGRASPLARPVGGVNRPFGRRRLGCPPPRRRGFCMIASRAFVRLPGPLASVRSVSGLFVSLVFVRFLVVARFVRFLVVARFARFP